MIALLIFLAIWGLAAGALARWAVPGPDPMGAFGTIALGLGGSVVGGGIAAALLHADRDVSKSDYFTISLASIVATIGFVIAYRRFVQKRPITGPEARKQPTRGWGLRRPGLQRLPRGMRKQ